MATTSEKKVSELQVARDAVESIWVAIVLAFVLRAFMVEAFVIPTGSMAPRLYGEHWMLQCPACMWDYAYGTTSQTGASMVNKTRYAPDGAVCPNCNYIYRLGGQPGFVRSGDRVLVLKYLYQFTDPDPWDVVVFRNPQNNQENYIKRLIATPGETVEIVHGDIYVAQTPQSPFHIRRKPPRVQEVMWQVIYDNDYPPDPEVYERSKAGLRTMGAADVAEAMNPPQWRPALAADDALWQRAQQGRVLNFAGGRESRLQFDAPREAFLPWYGYNPRGPGRFHPGLDIISDLKLSVTFIPQAADSRLTLLLSSFENEFRARFAGDGGVELLHRTREYPSGHTPWQVWATAETSIASGRVCRLALTHADHRVTVWVDGEPVLVSTDDQYPADYAQMRQRMGVDGPLPSREQRADWFETSPLVAIEAEGPGCQLRHLQLMRDVYYTSTDAEVIGQRAGAEPLYAYARDLASRSEAVNDRLRRQGVWSPRRENLTDRETYNPRETGWGVLGNPLHLRTFENPDLNEFFVLGDNSPQSHDARGWTMASPTLRLYDQDGKPLYQLGTVPGYNMLGRAMFVYWPSGFRVPGLPSLPLVPNVGRMRFIK